MFLRVVAVMLGLIGLAGIGLTLVVLRQAPAPQQTAVVAPAPRPAPAKVAILAAARPQRAGNLISAEDITSIEVPTGSEPPGSYPDTPAARVGLRGSMIRHSLAAGEPILAADVLNPGDRGFLAAVLSAGMRAVTVGVDSVSGTAGLIWPGDHVDLVLTQAIEDRDQPAARRVSGETVMTNLRVIAVDQQIIEGGQGSQANATNLGNANRTITLEASPYDAEKIAVASRLGRIALVVRAAADDESPPTVAADASGTQAQSGAAHLEPAAPSLPPAVSALAPSGQTVDKSQGASPMAATGPGGQADLPPVAWAGDVSTALRDLSGKGGSGSIRLYQGPTTVDEVKF